MTYDPNDPNRRIDPVYTEKVETVVVRESNTGWWIAGILGGLVLIAVIWILFSRQDGPTTDEDLIDAQVDAATAQANAEAAVATANAQASTEIARADAVRAQAEAARSANDARAAEARATTPPPPVIIERTTPAQPEPTPAPATTY